MSIISCTLHDKS